MKIKDILEEMPELSREESKQIRAWFDSEDFPANEATCFSLRELLRVAAKLQRAVIPPPEERQYRPEFLKKLGNREYVEGLLRHREMTHLFATANMGFPALVPMDIEAALVATHLMLPQPRSENPGAPFRSAVILRSPL
jgi:hypothetical protein